MTKLLKVSLLALLLPLSGFPGGPARAANSVDTPKILQEVEAAEGQFKAANGNKDYDGLARIYHRDFMDIHGSGWNYNSAESIDLGRNTESIFGSGKGQGGETHAAGVPAQGRTIVETRQLDRKVTVFGNDTAIVAGITETYFAIPNPEDEARSAGTLTRSPEATAKAIANRTPQNTLGPGEMASPNPYRIRWSRVWVRKDGKWQLALQQATRIGERTGRILIDH